MVATWPIGRGFVHIRAVVVLPAGRRRSRPSRPGRPSGGAGAGGRAASPGPRSLGVVLVRSAVGFSGSRSLPRSWFRPVALVVGALGAGRPVVVGCCRSGLDAAVRRACPVGPPFCPSRPARSVPRRPPRPLPAGPVAVVAASGLLAAFVVGPCPAGVVPSVSWSSGAAVSGSWSSVALAVGLGRSVLVFGVPRASLPSWPAGSWCPSRVAGVAGWSWVPASVRLPGI